MSSENLNIKAESCDSHPVTENSPGQASLQLSQQMEVVSISKPESSPCKNDTEEASASSNVEQLETLPSMGILPPDEAAVSECSASAVDSTSPRRASPPNANEVLHKVKRIKWKDIEVPILTQNNNGPCPLMAILNALILKGVITLPKGKKEFSGEELVSILGNAVFDFPRGNVPTEMHQHIEQNTNDAVSILHKLLTGLDVNVKFSGVRDFEFTLDLSIFDVLGIPLYHGWVADPESESALVREFSYNQLTNNIITWSIEAAETNDSDLYLKMMIGQEFLANSVSQLTIFGLFELGSTLENEEIAVLFRNNHFSTIYKRKGLLYLLLTDQGFLHERAAWETLNDVDATFSTFVTQTFRTIEEPRVTEAPTNEEILNSDEALARMIQEESEKVLKSKEEFQKELGDLDLENMDDEGIARALQKKEEERAAQEAEARQQPSREEQSPPPAPKKKKDCHIM